MLIVGRFDRLTRLTKYSLLAAPRPLSPVSPLGRQVRGDGVLPAPWRGASTDVYARCPVIGSPPQPPPPVTISPGKSALGVTFAISNPPPATFSQYKIAARRKNCAPPLWKMCLHCENVAPFVKNIAHLADPVLVCSNV